MLKVAVVLCGCGRADGSEIHESVSVLIHLHRCGLPYRCFAPDEPQTEVVNHVTGQPVAEVRNQMVEAARIARGDISPLASLRVEDYAAVVFPGGFGAAKNLCSFAKDGADCRVHPDVARILKGFHAHGKPIALACIAPVLAAKVLGVAGGGPGCELTLGSGEGVADAVAKMGAVHVPRPVTQAVVDRANKVLSTPAYMCDAGPYEVFTGIGAMIDALKAMLHAGTPATAGAR